MLLHSSEEVSATVEVQCQLQINFIATIVLHPDLQPSQHNQQMTTLFRLKLKTST